MPQNTTLPRPVHTDAAIEAIEGIPAELVTLVHAACDAFPACQPQGLWPLLRAQAPIQGSLDAWLAVATQTAVEQTSVEEPDWQYVAARLLLYRSRRQVRENRERAGIPGEAYENFAGLIRHLEHLGRYGAYIRETYSEAEIAELEAYIKPERDFLFTYVGLKQLLDRYVIRGLDGELLELPQELFMGVAMHLALGEVDRVRRAKEFYDVLSSLKMTVATPTLSNARKRHHQLSSCFIDMPEDDLISIYETDKAFARVSKHGGGMGIYVGKIRSRGAAIRGHKGASGGVIPWIKNYNNTAVSCNQLGMRQGAAAIYLDVWHKDILDFLQLRTNNGDERMKAHDIFPAVCVPDEFMRRVERREAWYLFCPHEVEQVMGFRLEDSWGEEFERRYQACIDNPQLDRVEVPAIDVMRRILQSAFETGTPFVFFRDTANRMNPNKHAGMVYCSNLCTEIVQNMSPMQVVEETTEDGDIVIRYHAGDFVVCNLSSLNLGRCEDLADIERVVERQVRMLDNVIDQNEYPVPQAKITNQRYRAVGLGISGYHQYLAERGIQWESEEHLKAVDELFEWINFFAIRTSMRLAQEKGAYPLFAGSDWQTGAYFDLRGYHSRPGGPDWDGLRQDVARFGLRNGYLFAVAPTSSTSLIAGSTAGIDPVFARFFLEEKKNGVVPQTAPNLNERTFWYYKEAHTIDQTWSIRAAAVRQRHIDQSQSFNLYITPDIHVRDFLDLYLKAWRLGLKTIYYVRNKSLEVEDCAACSA
ncbi:MAG: ribonucleoside-diphosphate reductase subunit alpha [Alicyclobacillus herbarius]|uniref:ribonucleoside-diphosphate reductase subunit alpha n=1 Tax=Alicyclobacillus herbarius TaxID=122960 RepID=UPI002355BEA9|nr:ribonucleoside-diphosphate reductase subunit alpha [Alicyclobacillus herbarius]MCL6632515.1 ribonucleoside-diphosphate reductase subunit alpha [Alicyclobacillus herbarius]